MATIKPSAQRLISAPAEAVYNCIADYNQHHANILPKEFSDLRVESGSGVGEGTQISFRVTVLGRTQTTRAAVSEPRPGRVIVETYPDTGSVTTFTVEPAGDATRARIDSTLVPAPGIQGLFERLFARRLLDGIYARELQKLDAYARRQAGLMD